MAAYSGLAVIIATVIFFLHRYELTPEFSVPFLIGVLLIGIGIHKIRYCRNAENWPKHTATVISASVTERYYPNPNGACRDTVFIPKLRYEYSVGGNTYKSSEVGLYWDDYESTKREEMEQFVKQFPVNSTVPVYVDPKNPQNCALLNTTKWRRKSHNLTFIVAGVLIFLVGVLVTWLTKA